jgi:prophage regulatory protein
MTGNCLLAIADVTKRTTLSRSEIYRRVDAGTFPKPVRLSERRVAWRLSDLELWFSELVAV